MCVFEVSERFEQLFVFVLDFVELFVERVFTFWFELFIFEILDHFATVLELFGFAEQIVGVDFFFEIFVSHIEGAGLNVEALVFELVDFVVEFVDLVFGVGDFVGVFLFFSVDVVDLFHQVVDFLGFGFAVGRFLDLDFVVCFLLS